MQSYLNDEEVKNDIINSFSNGGAQKFLSLKMIAKISIPIPSLTLQQEFAEKIEAIERQKQLIKESIQETQTDMEAVVEAKKRLEEINTFFNELQEEQEAYMSDLP